MMKKPSSRSPAKRPSSCAGCQIRFKPHIAEQACFICFQPLHTFYCDECCILNMYKHIACPCCIGWLPKIERAEEEPDTIGSKATMELLQKTIQAYYQWQGQKPIAERLVRFPK